MKSILFILPVLLLILNSCNKNDVGPLPVSSFTLNDDTLSVLRIATSDEFRVKSKTENAVSIIWDFGDGRTSTDSSLILSYPESGTYTIQLTAKNADGQTSSSAKKVIVLDRVLKKIVITNIQWDSTDVDFGWPGTNTVDVYFQIQMFTNTAMEPNGVYPNCPIVYTSSVVENVTNQYYQNGTFTPIEIPVTEKIIIDKNMVALATPDLLNKVYIFSLMAKDLNGKTYSLITNGRFVSGASFGMNTDGLNSFTVQMLYFTSLKLVCDFE